MAASFHEQQWPFALSADEPPWLPSVGYCRPPDESGQVAVPQIEAQLNWVQSEKPHEKQVDGQHLTFVLALQGNLARRIADEP